MARPKFMLERPVPNTYIRGDQRNCNMTNLTDRWVQVAGSDDFEQLLKMKHEEERIVDWLTLEVLT